MFTNFVSANNTTQLLELPHAETQKLTVLPQEQSRSIADLSVIFVTRLEPVPC